MTVGTLLASFALLLCAPVVAQGAAQGPPDREDVARSVVRVALETDRGRIVMALDPERAPATVANFLHYVDSGKLDGESFYRAMPYGKGGLIQGGITSDARKLRDPIAHEPVSQTGLGHEAGAVSMANFGPGTARTDFFILTDAIPAFDKDFAVFGRVVEGMDVVRAILAAPVSPTKGEGPMKGQMLEPPVRIGKAVRLSD